MVSYRYSSFTGIYGRWPQNISCRRAVRVCFFMTEWILQPWGEVF